MSNLRLINETTVSSSVSSVNVTDVFSADFDIYKITADNIIQASSSSVSSLNLKFINSSGSIISTDYDYAFLQLRSDASFAEVKSTSGTNLSQALGQVDDNLISNGAVLYIFNPFNSSSYTFMLNQTAGSSGSSKRFGKGIGVLHQTNSITGINISVSSSNITEGKIRIFGLRVDS